MTKWTKEAAVIDNDKLELALGHLRDASGKIQDVLDPFMKDSSSAPIPERIKKIRNFYERIGDLTVDLENYLG